MIDPRTFFICLFSIVACTRATEQDEKLIKAKSPKMNDLNSETMPVKETKAEFSHCKFGLYSQFEGVKTFKIMIEDNEVLLDRSIDFKIPCHGSYSHCEFLLDSIPKEKVAGKKITILFDEISKNVVCSGQHEHIKIFQRFYAHPDLSVWEIGYFESDEGYEPFIE